MNKKLFTLIALLASFTFFYSCGGDDNTGIDLEWKSHNEKVVADVVATGEYTALGSQSKNGNVYWKAITDFVPDAKSYSTKITSDKRPYFTDSVRVRYEGWYLAKDGKKVIFDTTEGTNNGVIRGFRVNGVVDGFSTILQDMVENDQVEVCIPYLLGYGVNGSQSIPGYTTLFFRIKLLKIIPDNPGEWD